MTSLSRRIRTTLPAWILLLVLCTKSVYANADELLQKAIYTEETVGNIEEAMKLYEQVIAEGTQAQRAAAQAQYRLGLCYQKQQKPDLAATAFKTVVEKYADQTEIVGLARGQISQEQKLLPVPWKSGETLHLSMKLANGTYIGTLICRIDTVQHDGKPAWKCTTRGLTTLNGANHFSEVLCDHETFRPIQSFWRHSMLGVAKAQYEPEKAIVDLEGKKELITIVGDATTLWDNEQCFQLFRRLPLAAGYKTTLSIVSSLSGQKIPLDIEVVGKEPIEVPVGKFECYKLSLKIASTQFQTFWLSADEHRYVVRFEAGGASADLALVEQRAYEAPVVLKIDGVAGQLPKGWNLDVSPNKEDDGITRAALMDPKGFASGEIATGPLSAFKMEKDQSPRMNAEKFIKENKVYVVREPGIRERQVDGKAAAYFIADYNQQGKAMTAYRITIIDGERSVNMRLTSENSGFDSLQADVNSIVDSLQLE